MQDKRNEIVKYRGGLHAVPKYYPLMKVNRILFWVIFMLMALILVIGLFLAPSTGPLSYQKANASKFNEIEMNPVISTEINELKGQLIGLVSGSIENKLRTLEESVKLGSTEHTLNAIEDLKNDIKVLRVYSELPEKKEAVIANEQLAQEVTHLKKLIYIILASCGLMFAGAAGMWVKYRRLPNRENNSYLGRR